MNMNYLWGEWLRRGKLLSKQNQPNKQDYSPKLEKIKLLHSVPTVNISVQVNRDTKNKSVLDLSKNSATS